MAGRGRPQLPIGTYGNIAVKSAAHSTRRKPVYVARARFRDTDGVSRPVTRTGQTQEAARNALRAYFAERTKKVQQASVSSSMTVADLAVAWQEHGSPSWSTNTRERYALASRQAVAELGSVRLQELSRSGINTALSVIKARHGVGAAKGVKSVLSGMCKYALLFDAIDSNPVRDTISVSAGRRAKPPDALTVDQQQTLADWLRTDGEAVERFDLADLVEWMLGTGCRIGEACACRHSDIDLDAGTWEINATAVRVRGVGIQIQERPKTAAGWRVLALPSFAVTMVRRRESEISWSSGMPVVFGSPYAKAIRDTSNTAADLRAVLGRLGCPRCDGRGFHPRAKRRGNGLVRQPEVWVHEPTGHVFHEPCDGPGGPLAWVTSHTFRRTVATRLDEAGLSSKMVADQLGHAQPSMTLDRYMGRNVVSAEAAHILDAETVGDQWQRARYDATEAARR